MPSKSVPPFDPLGSDQTGSPASKAPSESMGSPSSEATRPVFSSSSPTTAPRSAPSTGSQEPAGGKSRSGSEGGSQMPSGAQTASKILSHTTRIGHLSLEHQKNLSEAQTRLIGIEGSLKALAGEDEGSQGNPVLDLLELLVQMSEVQDQRLERIEKGLERLAEAVGAGEPLSRR